jgi:hypothetical protein
MYDAASIESINCEQLVTATDRCLIRAGRGPGRRRPAQPSSAAFALPPSLARGSHIEIDRTVVTRAPRRLHVPSVVLGVAIPSLFGIVCGLAALL